MTAAAPFLSDPRLAEAVNVIRQRLPSVTTIYLYGSQARGDARPDSDVDLAVFTAGAPVSALDLWDIRLDLAVLFDRPVDLVHLDGVPTILQRHVVTTAPSSSQPTRSAPGTSNFVCCESTKT